MANQLRKDPTRTGLLQRQFIADMKRRFKSLSKAIQELVVDDDAFGLIENPLISFNQQVARQAWRFNTDAGKVTAYRKWLEQQVNAGILTPIGGVSNKPWTAKYIESSYRKGSLRAYTDLRAGTLASEPSLFQGGQAEFLRTAFNQPENLRKIELLATRSFTELKGVTDAMGQQMSRILASGLSQGYGPRKIARALRLNVSQMTKARANVIARTEIIRAHAEGQLDAFEKLGEKEVGLMAEWSTAGDERVCALCGELEGVVIPLDEARDLLPRHPNCRCAWIPAQKSMKQKGQLWGKKADAAIGKSILREGGKNIKKRSVAEIWGRSRWAGKDIAPSTARLTVPKSVVIDEAKILKALRKTDKLAIDIYRPPKIGVNAYNNAIQLNSKEAKAMLKLRGKTKAQIYTDILENRTLQSEAPATIDTYFGKNIPKAVTRTRKQLHKQFINDLVNSVKSSKKPQALFTGGYPGSGKSSMLDIAFPKWKMKYIHIDSDVIKLKLAKHDGFQTLGWRFSTYQKEADRIIKRAVILARKQSKNLLYDGTMKNYDKISDIVKRFKAKGYNIQIAFADLSLEKAMIRAISRMYGTGQRYVEPLYQASHGLKNINSFNKLKKYSKSWVRYNTDVAFGELPIKIVPK